MNLKDRLILTIHALAFGGNSVARTPKGSFFLSPGGVPGDSVEVEIVELKKKFGTAEIVRVMTASPDRREAPCPVFGICGGCQWQHIQYPSQLKFKSEMVLGALKKSMCQRKILSRSSLVRANFIIATRIQVRTQNGNVGFYKRGSHHIAPIEACPIAVEEINTALIKLDRHPDRKVELHLLQNGSVAHDENAEHGENLGFSQVNEFANQQMIRALTDQITEWESAKISETDLGSLRRRREFHLADERNLP